MLALALMTSVGAKAQFEQGTMHANASLSGLDINYTSAKHLTLGVQGLVGYSLLDNLMATASCDFRTSDGYRDYLGFGVGGRYYILQNGIYLGAGCKYAHVGTQFYEEDDKIYSRKKYDDFLPYLEVGYAFFISRTVTIEPAIYYEHSLKDNSEYSKIGFRLGFGIYL